MDLLVHIVRLPMIRYHVTVWSILRDIETINTELLLADMEVVEKWIERIKSGKK